MAASGSTNTTIWWPDFCGNDSLYDAFWSDALTINTNNPDFTECFQHTILTWVPVALIVLGSLFFIPYVRTWPILHRWGYITKFNLFKMVIGSILVVISILDMIEIINRYLTQDNSVGPELSEVVACVLRMVSLIMATVYIHWTFRRGFHTCGLLFSYWFFMLIIGIVRFRSRIMKAQREEIITDYFQFVTFYIHFALVLVQFISNLWVDMGALDQTSNQSDLSGEKQPLLASDEWKESRQSNPCPKNTASFLNVVLFFWFNRLVWQGYKRTLQYKDIWDIRKEDASTGIVQTFEREWEKELEKKGYIKKDGKFICQNIGGKEQLPSMLAALVRCFGVPYIGAGVLIFFYSMLQLVNPQLLSALIDFIETGNPYTWQGYVYAVSMWIFSMISIISMHNGFNTVYNVGLRVRTAAITAIYRKSLKLSSASRKGSSGGEIVNLMSVDAQKLQEFGMFLHFLWIAPFQTVLITYFLWQLVGIACLPGLAWFMFVMPVNSMILAKKIREFQMRQMKLKDSRIKLMNQVLSGIKVLKLYAWEPYFRDKILDIRNKELAVIKKAALLSTINYIISFSSNIMVTLIVFLTYIYTSESGILTPNIAFVSISLLNLLSFPVMIIPISVMSIVSGLVSVKRIEKFLLQDEVSPDIVKHDYRREGVINIDDGTFSWGEEKNTLTDVTVQIDENSLVAVVGQVGCGKSSFLSAILGEMINNKGTVNTKGNVAYVPQQAWIQNLTLRDNILFSKPHITTKYQHVLDSCALTPDLKILAAGDMTEIGERGINLSGGQKQRVSLARAVYQNADIYLLDDPLSAVDSHVGKHIFQKVIGPNGMLRHKTRVLVTNSVTFLPKVDKIIVLKDGHISEMGTYDELITRHGAFAEFIQTYLQESVGDSSEDDEQKIELQRRFSRSVSGAEDTPGNTSASDSEGGKEVRRRISRRKSEVEKKIEEDKKAKKNALIVEETAEEGNIQLSVIQAYVDAASKFWAGVVIVGFILNIGGQVGNSIWLSVWSNDALKNATDAAQLTDLRLGVYGALGGLQVLGTLTLAISVTLGCISASRSLHKELLTNIIKTPMSFFDTTPLGRIINRFSKDVDTLDADLRVYIQNWLATVSPVIATIIVIVYSTPIFIVIVIPLTILFVILQRVYITTARQIKRIDSIKRSPIYANFSESLNGVSSIRAYQQQDRFVAHSDTLLDNNQKVWFAVFSSNRWIGIWAELLGETIVLFAAVFCVLQRNTLDPGTVGLSLSFALQVSIQMMATLRNSCELETYIVAVERMKEYADVPQEAPWSIENHKPPHGWPSSGDVRFDEYCLRYRAGLDLVLKGVNCEIKDSEKVGIVGRTGAGKSSMTLALFRIIEAASGAIWIDGQHISEMGLHDIRSKLTIIPQDPVLFSGSLRFNIDPADRHTDDEVWMALEHAHLKAFVSSLDEALDYECGEDGENLSVGQRQLVCLARALLRKTKILVLDEATAAVDLETDDLIQNTIRAEFKDSTIITIAHRLNTIMDYDRVMVMDAGVIKEFDSPTELLARSDSIFYGMARDAGLV